MEIPTLLLIFLSLLCYVWFHSMFNPPVLIYTVNQLTSSRADPLILNGIGYCIPSHIVIKWKLWFNPMSSSSLLQTVGILPISSYSESFHCVLRILTSLVSKRLYTYANLSNFIFSILCRHCGHSVHNADLLTISMTLSEYIRLWWFLHLLSLYPLFKRSLEY